MSESIYAGDQVRYIAHTSALPELIGKRGRVIMAYPDYLFVQFEHGKRETHGIYIFELDLSPSPEQRIAELEERIAELEEKVLKAYGTEIRL